jgi:hypothetical protein
VGRRLWESGGRPHRRRSQKSGGDEGPRRVSPTRVVLTAAVLVVAACSGGDDHPPPPPKSSPVTSQTTTTTSTAAPNDIPVAARAHTAAGAVAFVRYFIDRVNYAWTAPEVGVISRLGEPGCLSCKSMEATAHDLNLKGHRYRTDPVTATQIRPVSSAPKGQQYVVAEMHQHRTDIIDAQGQIISTDADKRFTTTIALVWRGGSWRVFDSTV